MCGFVGYKITEKRDNDGNIIKSMADTIVHRGPDDEGYYVDEGVALGFADREIPGGEDCIFHEAAVEDIVTDAGIEQIDVLLHNTDLIAKTL